MQSTTFDQQTKDVIDYLVSFGGGQNYFLMNIDLLTFAMPVLIGSKTFNDLSSERRKELFNQYIVLSSVLECLDGFIKNKDDADAWPTLHDSLKSFGDVQNYFSINYDLLAFAMPELIASKSFNDLSPERRKDLFNQYSALTSVLKCLDNFMRPSPGDLWLHSYDAYLKN